MKRTVIFYFSGTGNTWWVSETLARHLRDGGAPAQACSIEQLQPGEAERRIRQSDVVGFGFPVYGSDLPQPMKDFIGSLPVFPEEIPCFVFCTQWIWSGDGARTGADLLGPHGFRVLWGDHFLMPNNVSVGLVRLPYTNDPGKLEAVRERNSRKIGGLARRILSGTPRRRGFSPVSLLLGSLQRAPFRRAFHRLRDDIHPDPARCTGCGYCIRVCPSGNLLLEGGRVSTRGTCVLCMRCYNFCPESAIQYRGRPHDTRRRGVPYRGPLPGFDPAVLHWGQASGAGAGRPLDGPGGAGVP